jgi:putative nucleotidyltransferase with HDIG domain
MLPLDKIILWVLGPAIGFGTFLLITIAFVLRKSRFRNPPNISFFIFTIIMLAASVSLVMMTNQMSNQQESTLASQEPIQQAFILLTISTLAASLSYYIYTEIEVTGSLLWSRFIVFLGGLSLLLAALADVGYLNFFPLNQNYDASGMLSAIYLLSAIYFLSAAWLYYKEGEKRFLFFTIAPLILLASLSLNALFFESILIAAIAIWVMYLGLTTTTVFEGLIKPTDARIQEVEALNQELMEAYNTTLEGWAKALELRDKETIGHSRRVTSLAIDLARALELGEKDVQNVKFGALLHDIGKMAIPDDILKKPGRLNDEERKIIESHPWAGYELIQDIDYLQEAAKIPLYHHEKWDGSGYPTGLSGEEIPYIARLFAIVDVWDAITSNRPYAASWPKPMARAYLEEEKGISFDPEILEVFLSLDQIY